MSKSNVIGLGLTSIFALLLGYSLFFSRIDTYMRQQNCVKYAQVLHLKYSFDNGLCTFKEK